MCRYIAILISLLFFSTINGQASYKPNKEVRKEIKSKLWTKLKPITPQQSRSIMGVAFLSSTLFDEYETISKKFGLPAHDIITAKSFFLIICEEVKNGASYNNLEIQNRYNAIKTTFETNQTDFELTNIQKQKKYETLVFTAIWLAELNRRESSGLAPKIAKQLLTGANSASQPAEKNNEEKSKVSKVKTKPDIYDYKVRNSLNDIEKIIMRTQTFNNISGMVYQKNVVYVLYKNGDVFKDPYEPLESMDIEKSKRKKPNKWHKWEKKNNIIYYTNSKSGKTYEWNKWFSVRNGDSYSLNGKFQTIDPYGGTAVTNASTVTFDGKRFGWKTVKGGVSDWKAIYLKEDSAGTFKIEGHTITLYYKNGIKEKRFFLLYPKSDQHFVIGKSHFVPLKK